MSPAVEAEKDKKKPANAPVRKGGKNYRPLYSCPLRKKKLVRGKGEGGGRKERKRKPC